MLAAILVSNVFLAALAAWLAIDAMKSRASSYSDCPGPVTAAC